MNTANLQLEGLYAAVSALMTALREKNLLSEEEIDRSLADAERTLAADPHRSDELSPAQVAAILFPLRYLRLANQPPADGHHRSFTELATRVGREKPHRGSADPGVDEGV